MTEFDPMDAGELTGAEATTDPVDTMQDDFDATADYTDTSAAAYSDAGADTASDSLDVTQIAPDASIDDVIVDELVAVEPEIAIADPVATTVAPPAPGTSSEVTAPVPPEPLIDEPFVDDSHVPYDAFATDDLDDWQSAYRDWQTAVTTTGHAPLIGGNHLVTADVPDIAETPTTSTEMDGVVGEPVADREFWFRQSETFSCGPATAAQILSDFTDTPVDERALIQQVTDNGWWVDEDGDGNIDGMSIQNLSQLMANNGVPNQVLPGTVDDLELYLSQGRSIVLFLDNENLPGMQELDGAENSAADDPNHFVRLTGIDTARGVAYLSDPGRADGQTLVVPLEMLEEAWNDSNNFMVVTDFADPTPDSVEQPTSTGTDPPAPTGTETTPASAPVAQADVDPAPVAPADVEPAPTPAPAARPASAPSATPSVVRTETVTTATTPPPPAAVAPLDLGVSDQINDMLQNAADAATPPVDLTTPSSQPDGLFDSALGFVLIPVAVSAGVAATLGYRQLRSKR